MRLPGINSVLSLAGSLGLHGGVLFLVLAAARRVPEAPASEHVRADAWAGSAVEVDAVATAEAAPAPAQAAPANANAEATAAMGAHAADPPAQAAAAAVSRPAPTAPPHQAAPSATKAPLRTRRVSEPAASEASGAGANAAVAGPFGAQGLPPGVRSLPSAFTRAIPPASGADPIWQSLPTGTQPPFVVTIQVDADGHIADAQIAALPGRSEIPTQFEHLRQRVIALLGGGLFALQNNAGAGQDRFRITISLSDRAVHEDSEPAELVERGFDPPHGAAPGRAYFTLASGRHFEAKVEVLGRARP